MAFIYLYSILYIQVYHQGSTLQLYIGTTRSFANLNMIELSDRHETSHKWLCWDFQNRIFFLICSMFAIIVFMQHFCFGGIEKKNLAAFPTKHKLNLRNVESSQRKYARDTTMKMRIVRKLL